MTKYINLSPNLSLVLPGECNAKCAFCFWSSQWQEHPSEYLRRLDAILSRLPDAFQQVSITGGEPTMSPVLGAVLDRLKRSRHKFTKVVLTTNGYTLDRFIGQLDGAVDFVNISRHSRSDLENVGVFGTVSVPSTDELTRAIDRLNTIGIPVTLSKVILKSDTADSILRFLGYARSAGASQVFLRKPHGDLLPHPIEEHFERWRATESSCPVCLTRSQVIVGMPVVWKRGILEPSDLGFHEAIVQPNGKLTSDWQGNRAISVDELVLMYAPARNPPSVVACHGRPLTCVGGAYSNGCGSFGCGPVARRAC